MQSSVKIKNFLTTLIISALFSLLMATFMVPTPSAGAADIQGNLCGGTGLSLNSSGDCQGGVLNAQGVCVYNGAAVDVSRCAGENSLNRIITTIINILSVVVGIVAVIMVIVGGFKFITSGGDSAKVTSARNTIIYALIGLIIVALAQVMVKFVLTKVA